MERVGSTLAQLESHLDQSQYPRLLEDLHRRGHLLEFSSWADVVDRLRAGRPHRSERDPILRVLLTHYQRTRDEHMLVVLLVIFSRALRYIERCRSQWDPDPEELAQNILAVFLEAVVRLNLNRRDSGLATKIVNDSFHRLHDVYRKRWKSAREAATLADDLALHVDHAAVRDRLAIEDSLDRAAAARQLNRARVERRISAIDYQLLLGTAVYRRSLVSCAESAGLPYETAKKRAQRARRLLERMSPTLSH